MRSCLSCVHPNIENISTKNQDFISHSLFFHFIFVWIEFSFISIKYKKQKIHIHWERKWSFVWGVYPNIENIVSKH